MIDEKIIHDVQSVTPVASPSRANEWKSRLLLGGAVIIVLGGLFIHHTPKAREDLLKEENTAATANLSAPQITPAEQQINQLKAAIETQQNVVSVHSQEAEEAEKLERMRMVAPTTVFSSSGTKGASQVSTQANTTQGSAVLGGNGTGDSNTQFMARVSDSGVPVANATHIAHPATTLAQGTMIWATLESRIASDLPGMIRAVTSEDIFSEDGSQLMLPKGSRLIGQYTNSIAQGQQRVFVVWQRVIRPDHIDVQLNSLGTDSLGTAGVGADSVDHHFFEQFGTAALLSIISAGAANIGVGTEDQFNSASAYREALANSFSQTAQNTLRSTGVIQPTLYINQGKKVSVFVARDLDFFNELTR